MPPSFRVTGGRPLSGTIRPAGNKNAALPILAATLLADGPCRIDNVPRIRDVETLLALLQHVGAKVQWSGTNTVEVDPTHTEAKPLDPARRPDARALRARHVAAPGWRRDRTPSRGYALSRVGAARGRCHRRRRVHTRGQAQGGGYFSR